MGTGRCAKSRCYPIYARLYEPTDQNRGPVPVAAALPFRGTRKLIAQAVELLGYHRKAAIRALRSP